MINYIKEWASYCSFGGYIYFLLHNSSIVDLVDIGTVATRIYFYL